ncbi:MAG: hypothetical protein AAFN77_11135 [Planctomycetota bacterium]
MSSGSHTHDTSGQHIQDQRFHTIEAGTHSVTVIFIYSGKDLFHLYFERSADIPAVVLECETVMLFKVPRRHSATFQITEVSVGFGPSEQGRYLIDMQLHPVLSSHHDDHVAQVPLDLEKITSAVEEGKAAMVAKAEVDDPTTELFGPGSQCVSDSLACPGTYSPCNFGQVVKKVAGVCKCVNPEPPGGGGGG